MSLPTHAAPALAPVVAAALAVVPAAGEAEEPHSGSEWRIRVEAAAVSRAETSIDTGGDFSRDSYALRFGADRGWTDSLSAGIALGYGLDSYDFSGAAGEPWDDIRSVRISLPVRYRADESWQLFLLPTLRYTAEEGADLNDGRETGILAAGSYRFSDRMTIGPGVGIFSEIEGGNDVFPILLVDWRISDTVSLETGRGLGASRGPGVTLRWRPVGPWTFSLGARYEKRRFRLDDEGPAPDGVGEEKSVPVALGAEYALGRTARLSVLAGAEFAGSLLIENNDGDRVARSDFDTAPFFGGVFTYRF